MHVFDTQGQHDCMEMQDERINAMWEKIFGAKGTIGRNSWCLLEVRNQASVRAGQKSSRLLGGGNRIYKKSRVQTDLLRSRSLSLAHNPLAALTLVFQEFSRRGQC